MFRLKRLGLPLLFPLIASLPVVAPAATTQPIVVTAARAAQTVDETLAPVTVITREELERRQVRSLGDLFRGLPGVTSSSQGGRGKLSSIFLRGAESDQVLVLIDGVKVGNATAGTTAFEHVPVERIERIEVVRGPRSHLYGSEAIGGVIQIFTRRGGGELKPSFSIGGGSFGTVNGSFDLRGGGERAWFNLGVDVEDTDGFNACTGRPSDPVTFLGGGGCFTVEPDDDGYENVSKSLRAGRRFGDGNEVEFHFLESNSEVEFDGSFENETESEQRVAGARLKLAAGENARVGLTLGRSRDKRDNFRDGAFAGRFDTERDSVSAQADFFVGDEHTLSAGIDYLDDEVDAAVDYAVTSRDNKGYFAQFLGGFGDTDLQVGLRRDDNEQFGGKTTGGVAVGRWLSAGRRATLAYGTAFKAPTFNELYWPNSGNPDLEPEESSSIELGLSGAADAWSLNLFRTGIDELIVYDASTRAPANVDSARVRGLEVAAAADLKGWTLNASLTLLDPESRAAAARGNVLPRRARESLRVDFDKTFDGAFGRYALGGTLVVEGRKYDDLANARKIDGYATVDLRASLDLGDDWRAQLKIVNLLDERYETVAFYPGTGRGLFVTLRYRP